MFNREFKMSSILEQHKDFLSDHLVAFQELTEVGRVEEGGRTFVHINQIVRDDRLKYHVNRRFDNLLSLSPFQPQDTSPSSSR